MSMAKQGARLGAAAFALGISLAGPNSLGTAGADTGTGDTSAASASETTNEKAAKRAHTGRSAPKERAEASRRQAMETPKRQSPIAPRPDASADSATETNLPLAAASTAPSTTVETAAVSNAVVPLVFQPDALTSRPAPPQAAAINVAVTRLFDSVSQLLTSLPNNRLTDWMEGTLLLVRRNLFNQAPTAEVTTYTTRTQGVVGKIFADDPEDETITYTLVEGPTHGAVTIDADGTYTYSATERFEGSDSFVVAVDNPNRGINLFDMNQGPTLVTVNVEGTFRPLLQSSEGFVVYNYSSHTIKYEGRWSAARDSSDDGWDPYDNGPVIGTLIAPGDSMRFEVTYYAATMNYAAPFFTTADDPYGLGDAWYGVEFLVNAWDGGSPSIERTECSGDTASCDWDTSGDHLEIFLMDKRGTVIDATNFSDDLKAEVLQDFADTGTSANITYSPPNGQTKFRPQDFVAKYIPGEKLIGDLVNDTPNARTVTRSVTTTESESTTTGFSSSVSADLFMLMSASIEAHSDRTLERSKSVTYEISQPQSAYSVLSIYRDVPVIQVMGDLKIQYGATTVYINNVPYNTPDADPNRLGRVVYHEEYLPGHEPSVAP